MRVIKKTEDEKEVKAQKTTNKKGHRRGTDVVETKKTRTKRQ
jgi:hypothetical protein